MTTTPAHGPLDLADLLDFDAYVRNALEHRITPYGVARPKLLAPPAMDWRTMQRLEADVAADRPGQLSLVVVPAEGKVVAFAARPVKAGKGQRVAFDLAPCRGLVRSCRRQPPSCSSSRSLPTAAIVFTACGGTKATRPRSRSPWCRATSGSTRVSRSRSGPSNRPVGAD